MKQYHELLKTIKNRGIQSGDRTGVGTKSCFGLQMGFDLNDGFPLLTTKKVHLKSIIYELLWMLKGKTNIDYLVENGVTIWNEWADENGELGPVYGSQWRNWESRNIDENGDLLCVSTDQIQKVINEIKTNPNSRRLIVSAWNVGDLPKMALEPCHAFFQFYVREGRLSCKLYQRSADAFLGVPFNIASYALLTMMVAQICDLKLGEFIHTFGDVHIYNNHSDAVDELLTRDFKDLPTMTIDPSPDGTIDGFDFEHFHLSGYDPHPAIKAPVAI